MHPFQKWAFFMLLCLGTPRLPAQSSFSLSLTTVLAEKPKTNDVMYNYTQLENLTGDTLRLRWVRQSVSVGTGGHGGGSDLGNWVIAVQDPENWYSPANDLDSADFKLAPGTNSTNKFILQLHPNNTPGNLAVQFKIYDIANPADSALVSFQYTVLDVASAIDEQPSLGISLYPNPAAQVVTMENASQAAVEAIWIGPDGRRYNHVSLLPGAVFQEDVSEKAPGQWRLWLRQGAKEAVAGVLILRD